MSCSRSWIVVGFPEYLAFSVSSWLASKHPISLFRVEVLRDVQFEKSVH